MSLLSLLLLACISHAQISHLASRLPIPALAPAPLPAPAPPPAPAPDDPTSHMVEMQDKLFDQILKKASFSDDDIKEYQTNRGKLEKSWRDQAARNKAHKADASKDAGLVKDAAVVKAICGPVLDGATGLIKGAQADPPDIKAIGEGILTIFSGVMIAVGAFSPGGLVAGAIAAGFVSLTNFVCSILTGLHGSTPFTSVMTGVIDFALDQYRYEELDSYFAGNCQVVKVTLKAFDDARITATSVTDARHILDALDIPSISTKLIWFMGKTGSMLKQIFNSMDPRTADKTHVPTLYNMWTYTLTHYIAIQQRAVNMLQSVSPDNSTNVGSEQQVYMERLRTIRLIAAEDLSSWNASFHDFADYLFIGDPNQPSSRIHLQLYSKLKGHGPPGNYVVGRTEPGGGDPYGTLTRADDVGRPPSQIEVQWSDSSTWKNTHVVFERQPVAFVNRDTNTANEKHHVLLYARHFSYSAHYCDIRDEGCVKGDQKSLQAMFTMERIGFDTMEPDELTLTRDSNLEPRKTGPIRSGDVVKIRNVYWKDTLLCGNFEYNSDQLRPMGDKSWYLNTIGDAECNLNQWRVVVTGNEELHDIFGKANDLYKNLTSDPTAGKSQWLGLLNTPPSVPKTAEDISYGAPPGDQHLQLPLFAIFMCFVGAGTMLVHHVQHRTVRVPETLLG